MRQTTKLIQPISKRSDHLPVILRCPLLLIKATRSKEKFRNKTIEKKERKKIEQK